MRRRTRGLFTLLLMLAVGACGDIFDVDNPTNIIDSELEDEQMLSALANTPEGAFSLAYDDIILDAALVSDEGTHHSSRSSRIELMQGEFLSWNEQYDDRYNELARARWLADNVLERLTRLLPTPDADARVAHAHYWGALSRVLLAEHFNEVPLDGGPPQTPAAILESAAAGFQSAAQVAGAAGATNLQAAALGSRARALRSLHYETGEDVHFESAATAAEAALSADATYRLDVRYQQPGSQNAVFARAATGNLYDGMHARMAFVEDPVSGNVDPRIQHSPQRGTDGFGVDIYEPLKYESRNADIPASRWQEAELILAEYNLFFGPLETAVTHLNRVRTAAGLPAFASTDEEEVFAQLDYERRVEFFMEGRRWQDMRYWGIMPPEWIPASQQAGLDRRWPVSQQERDTNEHYR